MTQADIDLCLETGLIRERAHNGGTVIVYELTPLGRLLLQRQNRIDCGTVSQETDDVQLKRSSQSTAR